MWTAVFLCLSFVWYFCFLSGGKFDTIYSFTTTYQFWFNKFARMLMRSRGVRHTDFSLPPMLFDATFLYSRSSGGACFLPRWCELLVGRPPLEMCTQCGSTSYPTYTVVDDAYPYPTRAEDFYSDYTDTSDSHNPTSRSSQSHGLLYLYIVGLVVIVRMYLCFYVSYCIVVVSMWARWGGPDGIEALSLIHIWRCRRIERCRSRWSPYH